MRLGEGKRDILSMEDRIHKDKKACLPLGTKMQALSQSLLLPRHFRHCVAWGSCLGKCLWNEGTPGLNQRYSGENGLRRIKVRKKAAGSRNCDSQGGRRTMKRRTDRKDSREGLVTE